MKFIKFCYNKSMEKSTCKWRFESYCKNYAIERKKGKKIAS